MRLARQREFGLPGRDCRTTKMRKRDARAAIAANAAQMRLCVKAIMARLAQSPGTSGRICKAAKSKTRDTSDTYFVADMSARLVLQKPMQALFRLPRLPFSPQHPNRPVCCYWR